VGDERALALQWLLVTEKRDELVGIDATPTDQLATDATILLVRCRSRIR
jgi:hypothetical protein